MLDKFKDNDMSATQPIIKPIFKDDSYVFSLDFYDNTSSQSLLESLTSAYLKDEEVSEINLKKVYTDLKNWSDIERFYYAPVLIFLTLYALDKPRQTWLNPSL